jgi:hypothetical protein
MERLPRHAAIFLRRPSTAGKAPAGRLPRDPSHLCLMSTMDGDDFQAHVPAMPTSEKLASVASASSAVSGLTGVFVFLRVCVSVVNNSLPPTYSSESPDSLAQAWRPPAPCPFAPPVAGQPPRTPPASSRDWRLCP